MEIVWSKIVKWIIALIILLVIIAFLVRMLSTGNGGPVDSIINFGRDTQPPTP